MGTLQVRPGAVRGHLARRAIPGARSCLQSAHLELWQARCIQGYLAVHLHAKIKLGELTKLTQLSRRKFSRTFKASFGCTPSQYVRRMRIARAQNLMTEFRDPLSQIAAECGFADQSHFSRCFRRVVGESPTIWRGRRTESGPRLR